VQLVRHPQTKGRDTDRLILNHRATSRLYSFLTQCRLRNHFREGVYQKTAKRVPKMLATLEPVLASLGTS
jgi:hypothetical protein